MVFCNLAELMANKNVNISTVARQTGISRTTLTALRYNTFKGVQTETLDALCKYFDIKPDKLFLFSKYELEIKVKIDYFKPEDKPQFANGIMTFTVSTGTMSFECDTDCTIYFNWIRDQEQNQVDIEADIGYFEPELNPDDAELPEQNALLKKILRSFENGIICYYEEQMRDLIIDELKYDLDSECKITDYTGISLSNLM